MMDPIISIIIPVYKAEKFLHKCVDSILEQECSDFELILVDDGSPDQSPVICDMYAGLDSRVKVIHQKNAGVSAARNRGIQEATGKFIGFVDSDDWVARNMFSVLLREAELTGADIVMCDALTVYEDGREEPDTISGLSQDCTLFRNMLSPVLMQEFAGSVCRCVYRKEMILEKAIAFPVGLKFSEDRIFNIYAMGAANYVRYIKRPLYMRYVNMESCVNSFHVDHFLHAKTAAKETEKAIRVAWNDDAAYQKTYLWQFVDASCVAARNIRFAGKHISLWRRYRMLDEICSDPDLQKAFAQSGHLGEYGKWIQKRNIFCLYCISDEMIQKQKKLQEAISQMGLMGVVKKCLSKLMSGIR